MARRIPHALLLGVCILTAACLIFYGRSTYVLAQATHDRLTVTLNGDTSMTDKPSELRTPVTCQNGTETEVVSYQKEGEEDAAFVSRHYSLVAAVQAGCPQ